MCLSEFHYLQNSVSTSRTTNIQFFVYRLLYFRFGNVKVKEPVEH